MVLLLFAFLSASVHAENACETGQSSIKELRQIQAQLTEKFAPQTQGDYVDYPFRQTCSMLYTDREETEWTCSAVLMPGNRKFLTSAHCPVDSGNTLVKCNCGVDSKTSKWVQSSSILEHTLGKHPNHDQTGLGGGFDIQMGELDQAIHCPTPFSDPPPLQIPPSMENAKALVARGDCYFTGAGYNNAKKKGEVQTVHAPTRFLFTESNRRIEEGVPGMTDWEQGSAHSSKVVVFLSHARTLGQYKFLESLEKLSRESKVDTKQSKKETLAVIQSDYEKMQASAILNQLGDYSKSSIQHGDSGGSLICLDEKKQSFLIGLLTDEFQTVTLLNDPKIYPWLNSKLKAKP